MAAIDYDTYELPKDIITMIKTTVAQIGPVEFVKHMLFWSVVGFLDGCFPFPW